MKVSLSSATACVAAQVTALQAFNNIDKLKVEVTKYCNGDSFDIDRYGEINEWDVSKVTSMYRLFRGSRSCNPPIQDWDVSNVKDFESMFEDAITFNNDISQWNVSQGTYFNSMFSGATAFNTDVSQWDVSQGTEFGGMFYQATSFNNDISQWDVSQGTDFEGMFEGATSLNCCSISEWPEAARSSCTNGAVCQPSKQLIIYGCLFALISFVLAMFYCRKTNRESRMNLCKAFAHDDSSDIFGDDNGLNVKKLSPDARRQKVKLIV